MDQRAAERSYGVADADLTPGIGWSLPALRRTWNAAKGEVAPWWAEYSKEAYNTGLDGLARGLRNWSRFPHRETRRPPGRFPRFKSRRRSTPTVRFTTGTIRVEPDRRHVTLPRLGRLAHARVDPQARPPVSTPGPRRILSATVRRDGGRWYVSFTVEVNAYGTGTGPRRAAVVGVDVGVTHLAVLSTGELVPNPRHLEPRGPGVCGAWPGGCPAGSPRTGVPGSGRRTGGTGPAVTCPRAHARVANLRRDGLHKLTTRLTREFGTIVVEDLNVAGMVRNRRLARHIADAGFAEIRRQLTYKTGWGGGRLVVADRWYPSSKTCSGCGAVKTKLALSERTYTCDTCGLILDRDVNAALNLAALAADVNPAGSGSVAGRGADQRTPLAGQVAMKRQPGTASAGQTGTVPPQGGTSDQMLTKAS